jgi:outer membrane receptor protein involved in Fe transport
MNESSASRDTAKEHRTMSSHRFRSAALGFSLCLGAAGAAADDAPTAAAAAAGDAAADPTRLQAVVVTAQKRNEAINSVPMAISSFRGEELQAAGVYDTRDLGKLVPGFSAADSGFDTPTYTMRGVGFADSSFATTSTVGLYADEVSLAYPIMSKGPDLDLRRVEVLQGPQGTLYGRNATGGAINTIANKPTGSFATGADVSYGSFDRVDAEGYVSGPLSESLKGRVAVISTTSEQGWQISNTRPDDRLGKLDKQAARATLDWQAATDLTLRLTLSGWSDRSQPQAPFALAPQAQFKLPSALTGELQTLTGINIGNSFLDPSVQNYPFIPNNKNPRIADWNPHPENEYGLHDNFWTASLRSGWDISEQLNLTGLFSFQQMRADGSSLPQGGMDVEDIDQVLRAFIRTYQGELRLSGKIGSRGDWLIGVNGGYDKHHEVDEGLGSENSLNAAIFGDTGPLDKPLFFQKGAAKSDTQVQSESAFADGGVQLLDTLKLTLGLRYTHQKQDYSGCTYVLADNASIIPFPFFTAASFLNGGNSVVGQGQCGSLNPTTHDAGLFVDSLGEHNLSWRSVLGWTPLQDTLLYASYSRGYKAGSFPTVFSVDQKSLAPVVQEKLNAYEVGVKFASPGGTLQANLSGYYYDYSNKQLLTYFNDPLFGALQYLQNVPKSLDQGVELNTTYVPISGFFLSASGSYIRTKVIAFEGDNDQGNAFNFAGQPFNYTPRLQTTLLANYTFAIVHGFKLSPGADFTYTGGTNATLEHDPLFALNAHRIYDLHLGLSPSDRQWSLSAYGRNLGNEFYRTSVVKLGDSVFAYAGMTRVYGMTFTCDFR